VQNDRRLLEVIAWGVLSKGEHSSQPAISVNALLGAAFTQDAKAIPLLLHQLRSSSALLRSMAIRLAASYGDSPLKEEILQMLQTEKVWYVRLELIQAAGQLRLREARPLLTEIIAHPKTLAEEKAAAIVSMVGMYDALSLQELKNLTRSDRAGLRQLACDLVAHLDFQLGVQEIIPLLKDACPEVRMSALNALGLMRVEGSGNIGVLSLIEENLKDSAPHVQITAGWVALLHGDSVGEKILEKWILSEEEEMRRLASGAVRVSGQYGVQLAERMLKKSQDSYVRANLALGMVGQREQVQSSCDTLYEVFVKERDTLWMWDNQINPLFRSLSPSRERHVDHIPHYPMVIDQMVRLDLLSVLSIVRYPKVQEAVRGFLQHRSWGVSATAASMLIQEGDEESFTLVKGLLDDPEEKIRLQAALILALLGSDPAAVKVLQGTYPYVDREMKVSILEALARVGDPQSIPFLTEILKEPFQVLRVVAASALIQCLYH
jgi:HEAT repeat protein